ncbi:MAG: class I SAM-dependent methyltransferase [Muribaculaceae bacterium]|nr:class I SAM-dependent methyltransferase [Muribaculaceae bacterium]
MKKDKDPMGLAIAQFHEKGRASKLRLFSPMFYEDEFPVPTLFREFKDMPVLEQKAIESASGRILDVGAGAGCHTLELQRRSAHVTAIDISPASVETMRKRGVAHALLQDFYEVEDQYDTVLMLMNGIGIVGTLDNMPRFFAQLDRILAPGGCVLFDSSDICYVFEGEDGIIELPATPGYYGEIEYQMQYGSVKGDSFKWLYIDADTMAEAAQQHGYEFTIISHGEHYDYLGKLVKKQC